MATAEPMNSATPGPIAGGIIPPLESGDHLTRDEFERRYHAMPETCHAELIDGVVYMASPVRGSVHGSPHLRLATWMGHYELGTPGVLGMDNTTVRLNGDNEVQPDLLIYVRPECGGRSKPGRDDYLEGPPEFVAEISASSASIDLHSKLRVYERNQVSEYLVWRTIDREIDWFVFQDGGYRPMSPDDKGVLRSKIMPGLWLNVPMLLNGALEATINTLKEGLASSEHAAFVERLRNPS